MKTNEKYMTCRVWQTTNRKLKIMAAKRDLTVIKLIEILVSEEEKRENGN